MRIIIAFHFLFFSALLYSQDNISYLSNEFGKIEFSISESLIYIQTDSEKNFSNYRINNKGKDFVIIEVNKENYKDELGKIQSLYNNVEPVLIYENGMKQVCFDEILIKTKNKKNIYDFFKGLDISVIESKFETNQFVVKIKNTVTYRVFELINTLYNNKNIEYIEPNFLFLNAFHTNDPYYTQQWAINNQGYLGGTIDADMDVDDAWNYTTGTGIKIAVLDVGVDLSHPDLQANLLSGYDALNYTTGGGFVGSDSNHGTPCAGIIGAIADNNIGIAGIAYSAKIIPVRIGHINTMNLNAAVEGINWAWQNGADVLSNSWGGGSPSSSLNNAINDAVTNGRGGKGCVVLFSSGNENSSSVSYPASLPNVIAVGATNMFDERKSPQTAYHDECWLTYNSPCNGGSNYGGQLDVVAPGVKVYTTDNTGHTNGIANGYNKFGNYYDSFNGTSAACPNAAGVIALILSANPNLTGVQARDILQKTTDKISGYTYNTIKPSGTWNNEVGYGRVNALKAVNESMFYLTDIVVSDVICGADSASLQNLPTNSPYTIYWSSSSNIQITGSLTNATVNFTVTPNSGQGWIKATLNGGHYQITKDIWIGKPTLSTTFDCFNNPNHPMCGVICKTEFYHPDNTITLNVQGHTEWEVTKYGNFDWHIGLNTLYIQPYQAGTIALTLKAKNACGTSAPLLFQFSVANCKSKSMNENQSYYKIYPNPSSDMVYISLKDSENQPLTDNAITGELYDLMGNLKSTVQIINNQASFSVQGLDTGIYVLKIYIDGQETEGHTIAVQ